MTKLKRDYKAAVALKRRIQRLTERKHEATEYYKLENELKVVLNDIRLQDFTALAKSQLIEFLCLCSSHRPCEPFALLVSLSMRRDAARGES